MAEARDAITTAYDAIARLIAGRSEEVALFDNTTHGWNAGVLLGAPSHRRPDPDRPCRVRQECAGLLAGRQPFATWEHSYINVLGLDAAVRQAFGLGLDAIGQRAAALGARLRDQLGELPGVTTHDLGQTRCAIVTAKIHGLPAKQVARKLGRAGANVSATRPVAAMPVAGGDRPRTDVRSGCPLGARPRRVRPAPRGAAGWLPRPAPSSRQYTFVGLC